MLIIDDVLAELDVLAVDSTVLADFASSTSAASINLAAKRRVVVDDWLRGGLEQAGFSPERHLVRRAPDHVWGYTGGAYTDLTDALSDRTVDDVDLSTVVVSAAVDALYIRSRQPFRGVWCGLFDSVNGTPAVSSSWTYWDGGRWAGFNSLVDDTAVPSSTAFSGGGRVSWQLPTNWQKRPLSTEETWGFWARLQLSAPPSAGTDLTHVLPIRASRLTMPCVYQVLALLYSESWGAQRGEWREKATEYRVQAGEAMTRALAQVADEFTTDEDEEALTATMPGSVAATRGPSPFTWERG